MKTKYLILYTVIMAVVSSCSSDKKHHEAERAVSVKTYYPSSSGQGELFFSGMVSAKQTAVVSTKLMGTIERILVRQGDVVKAGQTLVVINSTDVKARQAQAAAMIVEAEAASKDAYRDYQRYQVLREQNSVSDKELESMALRHTSAMARLQVARQGLREVNSMLAYSNIKAPFSGVVTQKMVDEGSIANPGMPLLTIEQSGDLNVTASVPESYVAMVKKGERVNIDIKSLGTTMEGYVSELSPSATATGGQYAMKIAISQQDRAHLRAGMYAGIRISNPQASATASGIMVRKSSIVHRDQLMGVYVAGEDNRAVLHWVRLGSDMGDHVEVLSGLTPKDRVIDGAGKKLYNGQKIIITD
ncbi:MAG: efflux RND transporter periplasmic adaptor subunit [Prevotella sp.]|nr:efflux RND transporter periplasmic adaptor subunit [Prevotella sp.]